MVSGGDGRPKRWYLCPSVVKKFKCDSTAGGRQLDGCACVSATVQADASKHCLFGDGACHVVLVLSERTRVLCGERGAMVSSSRYAGGHRVTPVVREELWFPQHYADIKGHNPPPPGERGSQTEDIPLTNKNFAKNMFYNVNVYLIVPAQYCM